MLTPIEVSQSPEDKFREFLASRAKPQRFTKPQHVMVQYIFSKHNHFDADKLIDEMKAAGLNVSRATVYRTLGKLVEAGLLRRLDLGPRMYYEHDYGYPQHDHLICQKCHQVVEFQMTGAEETLREICAKHQFQYQGHSFVIRGTCSSCNRAKMTKRRLDLV